MDLIAQTVVIPPLDPFGVPAAPGVFIVLTLLTMLLHVLFMNFAAGGALVATALDTLTLLGRGRHDLTVRIIWQVMPVALSLAITAGVAPLLFVQVLYGHFFYTANVLMGFVWFAVIPLLIVGFYLAYFISRRLGNVLVGRPGAWNHRPGRRVVPSAIVAVIFLSIGWVLTNNHVLSLQPEAWPLDGQWKQNRWLVTPLVTLPRFAHNVGGMLAVTGVWIAAIGWWRQWRKVDPPVVAQTLVRTGLWIVTPVVMVEAVAGPLMLLLLPAPVRGGLLALRVGSPSADPLSLTGSLSILWYVALLGVGGQIAFAIAALRQPTRFRRFAGLAACLFVTLAGMLAGRERVRLAFLARRDIGFELADWPVHWQRSILGIFCAVAALGAVAIVWLIRTATAAPDARPPSQPGREKIETAQS